MVEERDRGSRDAPSSIPQEGMHFWDRLKQAMGHTSTRAFARAAGVSEAALRQYLNGQSEPTLEKLLSLAKTGGVSTEWLATGAGSRSPAERTAGVADQTSAPRRESDAPGQRLQPITDGRRSYDVVHIPSYVAQEHDVPGTVPASADGGNDVLFRRSFLKQNLRVPAESLALVVATGDSMYPTIKDGDILLIDKSDQDIREDAIYIVIINASIVAKRVQLFHDGTLYIKSDNAAYNDQVVPPEHRE